MKCSKCNSVEMEVIMEWFAENETFYLLKCLGCGELYEVPASEFSLVV